MSASARNDQAALRQNPDFDFWDFVSCAVCHVPYCPPDRGPPQVPFWITECGHVLCNSHLNPDQSCAKCGDRGIQLIPLQRNMDPPMSDWFRLLPHAVDGIANAIKFQQESLAALVRHYRNQCLQLSATCDRLRNERRLLRKDFDALRREHNLCRSRGSMTDQPWEQSAHLNHNGKRPMLEMQSQNGSARTNSSPRSIPTPVGPLRLTLPPGEHPGFSRQESSGREFANTVDRPGSSRFTEQYAYHGGDHPRLRAQPTDEQLPMLRQPRPLDVNHSMMVPPLPPDQGKRFKPATPQMYRQTGRRIEISTSYTTGPQQITKTSENMGPPPTPKRPFSAALQTPSRGIQNTASNLFTNRFTMPTNSSHGRIPGHTTMGPSGGSVGGNRIPFTPQSSNGVVP